MNSQKFPVQLTEGESIRADSFAASLGLFTRSQLRQHSVRILDEQGQQIKPSRKLRNGTTVTVVWEDAPPPDIQPEAVELDIIHEDENCVVLNKAAGCVVHPAHGHIHGTLVQGLMHRYADLQTAFDGDTERPGVVHRLDKDTSGLIIAARNPRALEMLSAQFRGRSVRKTYLAITRGVPNPPEGEISDPIGRHPHERKKYAVRVRNAKEALSRYSVLDSAAGCALVKVRILTGRTHQIRVHLQSIGTPVMGDPLYSRRSSRFPHAQLMLHSWKLEIHLPDGKKHRFTAPLPPHFTRMMHNLGLSFNS